MCIRTPLLALALLAFPGAVEAKRTLYTGNVATDNVSAFDVTLSGQLVALGSSPFSSDEQPRALAVSPDGKRLFVANSGVGNPTISVFDISATGALTHVIGSPFVAGGNPGGLAVSPDGTHLYATGNNLPSGIISAFTIAADGSLGAVPGSPFPAGGVATKALAIDPDGTHLWVTNANDNEIVAFSVAPNGALAAVPGGTASTGSSPLGIAVAPDGAHIFVANGVGDSVSRFSVAPSGVPTSAGTATAAGDNPEGLALTPDGTKLFVANRAVDSISAYTVGAGGTLATVSGSPFPSGDLPAAVVTSPDSKRLYALNSTSANISSYDISADGSLSAIVGSPFAAGGSGADRQNITFSPNQPPAASFTASGTGASRSFDAAASADSDGAVQTFDWDFGDGTTLDDGGPSLAHSYAQDGTYTATLTATDNEGCSTAFVFTGLTAACNGGSGAVATQTVVIETSLPPDPPDTTPPDTSIGKKPKAKLKTKKRKVKATVEFSSEPGATFTCKVDGASFKPCSSPFTTQVKAKGGKGAKHTISVVATDAAGNVDSSPATASFKAVRKR